MQSRPISAVVTSLVALSLIAIASHAKPAFADDSAASNSSDVAGFQNRLRLQEQLLKAEQQQLVEAHRKLNEQLKELKQQEKAIREQQRQITALQSVVFAGAGVASAEAVARPRVAAVPNARVISVTQTSQAPAAAGERPAEAGGQASGTPPSAGPSEPEQRPEIADVGLASQGGVLTPKGVFSFEPTYQYQYTSSNQVVIQGLTVVPGITIGSENVRQLVDRMQTMTLGGRLGITDRLEVEAQVPYVYRSDTTTLQPLTANGTVAATDASGHEIGDIQFGAHYQLNSGAGGWPYFVANILAKSDTGSSPFSVPVDFNTGIPTRLNTGTGFWAIQPSITAILPSDPVVFFGNLRYIWNFGKDVTIQPTANTNPTPTRAHVQPGNGVGVSFGMGFGINDKSSFSLAYAQTYLGSTIQNGATIPGSTVDIGSFNLGFAYQLGQRTSVNLGIAIGTTKASPDAAITLKIPVKFQVF